MTNMPWTKFGVARTAGSALLITVLVPAIAAIAELGFSRSVTAGLVERYAGLFGAGARQQLSGWQKFMPTVTPGARPADGITDASNTLDRVNSFVNRVPWKSDIEHWKAVDYWATPAETFASNGGDCEDFVIAKYYALKELGMPVARLRFVYVRTPKSNETHMVLAYYSKPEATPLILDNLVARIMPASERTDLTPVYSFNDDDLVFAEGRAASRGKLDPMLNRNWKDLVDKLQMELRY